MQTSMIAALSIETVLKYVQILLEIMFARVTLGIYWEKTTKHAMVSLV